MLTIRTTTRSLFAKTVLALLGALYSNPLPMRTFGADPESLRQRQQALAVATSAYIYGYPLVLMEFTKLSVLRDAQTTVNTFIHSRELSDADSTTVVRPNNDTLYSTAFLDLLDGPIQLHVPDTSGRYYQMQMLDAWSNTFASPGARTTGTLAQDFCIVGPNWRGWLPRGMTIINAPTNLVWIIGRTKVKDAADTLAANAIQDMYSLAPLVSSPSPTDSYRMRLFDRAAEHGSSTATPPERVAALTSVEFFNILSSLMCDNPSPRRDDLALLSFSLIDFIPCMPFNPTSELRKVIDDVPQIALATMFERSNNMSVDVNGWSLNLDVGTYGVRYLDRATIALVGFGANIPEDAIYPSTSVDRIGQPLDGSASYRIHFAPDQIPPVDAFWSITLYDNMGFFYDNPHDKYTIHDTDMLNYNADGSLDIYLQNSPPIDPILVPNWLPIPNEKFNLTMRMYSPQESALNGDWVPPRIHRAFPQP